MKKTCVFKKWEKWMVFGIVLSVAIFAFATSCKQKSNSPNNANNTQNNTKTPNVASAADSINTGGSGTSSSAQTQGADNNATSASTPTPPPADTHDPNLENLTLSNLSIERNSYEDIKIFGMAVFDRMEKVTIATRDVTISFAQSETPAWTCTPPLPITVNAGEKKILTFSTPKTSKYNAWSKQVSVFVVPLAPREVTKLTVHGVNAASGMVTIPHDKEKVEKADIELKIEYERDDFTMSPERLELAAEGARGTITLSLRSDSEHTAWSQEIVVKRGKDFSNSATERTMEDVVDALRARLAWAGTTVEADLPTLPENLDDTIPGVSIKWTSKTRSCCDNKGKITRDLKDATATLEANITYKGENKKEYFYTTVRRLEWFIQDNYKEFYLFARYGLEYQHANGNIGRLFEIKEIDVVRKKMKLALLKAGEDQRVESLDALEKDREYLEMKEKIEKYRGLIAQKYDFFMNASTLSLDEFKNNLGELECFDGASAKNIFADLWDVDLFYTSQENFTFEEFENLSDAERAEKVKARLQCLKKHVCSIAGVSPNLSAANLEYLFLEIAKEALDAIKIKKRKAVHNFGYRITKNRGNEYEIYVHTAYDPHKNWYEQAGEYRDWDNYVSCDIPGSFARNGRLYALLHFMDRTLDGKFVSLPVEIKADGSFEYEVFNTQDSTSEKIMGRLTDHKNRSVTVEIDSVGNTGLDCIIGSYNLSWSSMPIRHF